jgi:hypothetical protein
MNKSKPQFKLDDSALLEHALRMMKMTRIELVRAMHDGLKLSQAQHMQTTTQPSDKEFAGNKLYAKEQLYRTPTALIKTTMYNRIKAVEMIPQQPIKPNKPTVIVKRRRTIEPSTGAK